MNDRQGDRHTNMETLVSDPHSIPPVKPLKADLAKACYELTCELPILMQNWPKSTRMGLGRKLEEHIYRLLDTAVFVGSPTVHDTEKIESLKIMGAGADAVLVYLRLGHHTKEIDVKRYQRLSSLVVSIGNQVGGLKRYLEKQHAKRPR